MGLVDSYQGVGGGQWVGVISVCFFLLVLLFSHVLSLFLSE